MLVDIETVHGAHLDPRGLRFKRLGLFFRDIAGEHGQAVGDYSLFLAGGAALAAALFTGLSRRQRRQSDDARSQTARHLRSTLIDQIRDAEIRQAEVDEICREGLEKLSAAFADPYESDGVVVPMWANNRGINLADLTKAFLQWRDRCLDVVTIEEAKDALNRELVEMKRLLEDMAVPEHNYDNASDAELDRRYRATLSARNMAPLAVDRALAELAKLVDAYRIHRAELSGQLYKIEHALVEL